MVTRDAERTRLFFRISAMTESETDLTSSASVYRVAVRLPPFWADRPSLWFAQAEAQFELAGVTHERTKFNHVVSQLDSRFAAEVEDVITAPGAQPYEKLKSELVRRLSPSREQRLRQFLTHEEMGDRKPSQFLRHLRSLATDVPDDLLRSTWSSRLPTHLQTILAGQSECNLDALSLMADRIHEVSPQPSVAAASHLAPPAEDKGAGSPEMAHILRQIDELSRQVSALSTGDRAEHRRQVRSRERRSGDRRTTDRHNSPADPFCWYHRRFGSRAVKCSQPCSFQTAGNTNSSR